MLKKTIRFLFADKTTTCFVIVGVILLSLTIYFDVNPVEGSVVDKRILGTPLHYVLFVTTIPTWIAAVCIEVAVSRIAPSAGAAWLWLPVMFLVQILLYWIAGRVVGLVFRRLWARA